MSSLREREARRPIHLPFGSCLTASLASSRLRGLSPIQHNFTLLPSLASCRMMLAALYSPCGLYFTLSGSEYIVRVASDMIVTNYACTPRLLPEERQVLSCLLTSRTVTYAASRRTHAISIPSSSGRSRRLWRSKVTRNVSVVTKLCGAPGRGDRGPLAISSR